MLFSNQLAASLLLALTSASSIYASPLAPSPLAIRASPPPKPSPIRGVNLGSAFIFEPWMAGDAWSSMGCASVGAIDEYTCVQKLGQAKADAAFKKHWETWITQKDLQDIKALGLNTVRIPVGYWIKEDLVNRGDEHFPKGGLEYLDKVVGWAADQGIFVIMDLHGGPGVQFENQSYTGRVVNWIGFYNAANYERAYTWLEWMAERIHTNNNYRTVGMLEVLNEPVHSYNHDKETQSMIKTFYPGALKRIRAREDKLGVGKSDRVIVQFMGKAWGSGDPAPYLGKDSRITYDDHRYYKWASNLDNNHSTKKDYHDAACSDNRGSNVIVGEWSISVSDKLENKPAFSIANGKNIDWYKKYFGASVRAFEKSDGWVFWSWKCNWIGGKDEWRWCYQSAVNAGVIPKNAADAAGQAQC